MTQNQYFPAYMRHSAIHDKNDKARQPSVTHRIGCNKCSKVKNRQWYNSIVHNIAAEQKECVRCGSNATRIRFMRSGCASLFSALFAVSSSRDVRTVRLRADCVLHWPPSGLHLFLTAACEAVDAFRNDPSGTLQLSSFREHWAR